MKWNRFTWWLFTDGITGMKLQTLFLQSNKPEYFLCWMDVTFYYFQYTTEGNLSTAKLTSKKKEKEFQHITWHRLSVQWNPGLLDDEERLAEVE
jgi:hypothetical protein